MATRFAPPTPPPHTHTHTHTSPSFPLRPRPCISPGTRAGTRVPASARAAGCTMTTLAHAYAPRRVGASGPADRGRVASADSAGRRTTPPSTAPVGCAPGSGPDAGPERVPRNEGLEPSEPSQGALDGLSQIALVHREPRLSQHRWA